MTTTPAMRALALTFLLSAPVGCGSPGGGEGAGTDAGLDSTDASSQDGHGNAGTEDCEAPDMLVLLDRTMSMHRTPSGSRPTQNTAAERATSKWAIAVSSIDALTASLQDSIRFGLALFPLDPGGDQCVTLGERIEGITATNETCQPGEVLISPAPQTHANITAAVDVETTRLCTSTPIGQGLTTAREALASIQDPIREQFVVLITDGADTCDEALAIEEVQAMQAAGVATYVIGFGGGGVDSGMLNDLACAGGTATNFPAPCSDNGTGGFIATNRNGPALFQLAEDAQSLAATLQAFAGEVCCGCIE